MSTLQSALLINVVVLLTTLHADLGTKAVSRARLLRPLIVAVIIVPVFVHTFFDNGIGLAVEICGLAAGVLFGLVAVSQIQVFREPDGQVVARAGRSYAALWIGLIVARSVFSIGATYWYESELGRFFFRHGAPPQDIASIVTNGLVFMAIAALLTRSGALKVRASGQP
ncbi:hypothetical protein ABZ916_12070 [Streptomyces sp. NPDC046853]|uniref:hypothetical protein n=1 Tax=Streptomyces sp. NPDC046853 TaxID=3154920 RepID=UPI0033E1A971